MAVDHSMTIERVLVANEVLAALAEQARALPGDAAGGSRMHAYLSIAQLYLMEYAKRLADGRAPTEALLAAATGELELSERAKGIWQVLAPPDQ